MADMVPAPEPEPSLLDCAFSGSSSNAILGLRVGALFAILAVSIIGASIPFVLQRRQPNSAFFVVKVFAAGVVIATGFVHILPDAAKSLGNPCLGFSTSYPWAFTIAGFSALLTFALEHVLMQVMTRRYEQKITAAAESTVDVQKQLALMECKVVAIVLEAGVIFHSIFIGLSLGINHDATVVRPLMIALMFHQGFEGLALGTVFLKAGYKPFTYWACVAAFVLTTPLGIAIGIAVDGTYNGQGRTELGTEGAFNAISAGILIYNGLVDLLIPAFSTSEMPTRSIYQYMGLSALATGYCCMALLAKWA